MKFTLSRADRSRNPLVAPSLFRKAGSHRRSHSTVRQQARQALTRELRQDGMPSRTTPEPHSP
jgi:hypothetical protein